MFEYFDSTGGYPNNPEDYISVPHPGLVNPGPVTTFDHVVLGTVGADDLFGTSGNDEALYDRNLKAIVDRLVKFHGLPLSPR